MSALHNRFQNRGPLAWKVLDGALDMLPPHHNGFSEAELVQWLEFVEQALRRFYDLPAAELPKGTGEKPQ